jgi:ABC-type branched-subunit amino acid transport system ATPase component
VWPRSAGRAACGGDFDRPAPVGGAGPGLRRNFKILLLDEPSSGLDAAETNRFGNILREIIARRGTGILLVEHDMSLVMEVSEYIYVIDFGIPIFEGTPPEVRHSEIVRAAYLGSEAVEKAV